MLRSWHQHRSNFLKRKVWQPLDLFLVTSTEPAALIDSIDRSPFNVAELLLLSDLDRDQVVELNARHDSPFSPEQVQQLHVLVHGQPFLTRRALYMVAGQPPHHTPAQLLQRAADPDGPFADHLRHYLLRLQYLPDLAESFRLLLRGGIIRQEAFIHRLQGIGLVRRDGDRVSPRCQLYADYYRDRL